MKIVLTKPAKIMHNPGDIVEVSPEVANFLMSVGSARQAKEEVIETPEKPTKKATKKK